jgi:hypothetical protein
VIKGVAYDTDTSELVASCEYDGEVPSEAWWSLYRNKVGAFFEVAADHDGRPESWTLLSDVEAQRWLERHANHLVERYFGRMPEASPKTDTHKFSRRSIVAAARLLDKKFSHGRYSAWLRSLGPAFATEIRDEKVSMEKRVNDLIDILDHDADRHLDDGELLRDRLVEQAAALVQDLRAWSHDEPPAVTELRTSLERDGFTIADGALRRTLPAELALPEAEDEVGQLLNIHGFVVPLGHLKQALDAHAAGNWASANAQIRSFFDGLLDQMAEILDPTAAGLASGQPRRSKLASLGFLSLSLNEWDNNGLGFINGLVKRLHPHGSHPGLSDKDDSTFRLHTVLITARLLLVRFDKGRTP